jgi:adenosylmethionine-8-amino-7-oxononanoate aminotransferase
MGALEMVKDKKSKTSFDGSISIGEKVANQCIENGLICRPLGPSIVLCPPFITTEDEMDIIFDTLEKTLKKVFSEVKALI